MSDMLEKLRGIPDLTDLVVGEFRPCVVEHKTLGLTQIILRDTSIVWQPFGPKGHCVDLGYDSEGNLAGMQVWDTVAKKKQT